MNETPENLTFAQIVSLQTEQPEEFERLVLTIITDDEDEDAPKKRRFPSKKVAGKIICILRSKNPDYFEKQKPCRGSWYGDSCATAYSTYVLVPDQAVWKIAEFDYDNNTTEVVECAASVVIKVNCNLQHPAVADAAEILRQRPSRAIKRLREICDRIQHRIENEGTEKETTRILYLTTEEYAAQQLTGRNAPSLTCASDLEPASQIGKEIHHSELSVPLEKRATSTPDLEEARSLAIHAANILAGLANNRDEYGRRRFSDEEIAAWTTPDSRISRVTEESLNVVYDPTTRKVQEIEIKLNEAGSVPIQSSFLQQSASRDCLSTTPAREISLKRWRNAEQRVCELLRNLGWQVEDVSQRKMGYDIFGRTPEGNDAFIDVKSIENPGQPFTLTPHEVAVAGQKGLSYQVALVRQTNLELEIALIADPLHRLKLTEKCRQWEWECAEYEFSPQRYPVD